MDRLDMQRIRFGASSLLAGLRVAHQTPQVIAQQGISLIDHTSLGLEDTEKMIQDLMDAAVASQPRVAAVCIYPRFVPFVRKLQAMHPEKYPRSLRVATVVNFPGGNAREETVVAETKKTVADGADEVDMVIDYNALKRDKNIGRQQALTLVKAVRACCPEGQVLLKVIIESGELASPDLIAAACDAAIEGGCDFVKTSTGKVKVNATIEAAEVMLGRIAAYKSANPWGRTVGFKAAGGVKTVEQVEQYLKLAARLLCDGHLERVDMARFRFGASSLLGGLRPLAHPPQMLARLGISMIDHTSLGNDDTEETIHSILDAAVSTQPQPAALCVFPQFVPFIRRLQAADPEKYPHSLKVATVVNFPHGTDPWDKVTLETRKAIGLGADEIDVVIDYNAIKADKVKGQEKALRLVRAVRRHCPEKTVLLKVIIESGELETPELIAAACDAAIEGGADFLKTSTGKVKVNATLEAAEIMLGRIAAFKSANPWGRPIGLKVAGGVKTLEQAEQYLKLAARMMCDGSLEELDMSIFRFGSSSLLAALRADADGNGSVATVQTAGY
eukprot:gnl/MRDRNA2_/MRDRNA2_174595_c0_seq1.p1 gnl/MRDRNA2_/MRDRNA2_174595_c0~~gnl/MRDRNA2_/MRDRNA2_174595_c0_seq1.p1  ORF type:complete len:597 (+),score=129.88 gnl/MRDRNA2_/MRDRNA2_174595_c0_seq1:117-1793(+)